MANYTPYLDLKKPLGSEYYNVADQNGNMDKIDTSIQGLGNGLGIIAKGNTHAAITSGEYVYVHGHDTLAEGLYKATANIAANGTLSSSNLAALSKGVGGDVSALNSKIDTYVISSNTLSNVESALVSFGATLGNNEIRNIKFNISTATGVFNVEGYIGTIKRYGNGVRYIVEVQNCDAGGNGEIITGRYYNSTWSWESLTGRIIANNLQTAVDLSGYASGDIYTFPDDGYIHIQAPSDGYIAFRVRTVSGSGFIAGRCNADNEEVIYVKKGMRYENRTVPASSVIEYFALQ